MQDMGDTTDPRVGTTFTQDGWTITVDTQPDSESSTADADCYTRAQIDAWKRDEWSFVGCVVTASREGITLGHASLWGMESGRYTYTDEDDTVTGTGFVGPYTEAVDDLITEAITDGAATLAKLCQGGAS
jgi:hypothetical protein